MFFRELCFVSHLPVIFQKKYFSICNLIFLLDFRLRLRPQGWAVSWCWFLSVAPGGMGGGQFVQFVFWSKIVKLHVCNVCYIRYYVSFYLWWMVTVFGQRSMFYLKKTTNKSWKLFNDTFLVLKYNSASYKKTFVYTDNHEQSISSKVAKSSKIRQE